MVIVSRERMTAKKKSRKNGICLQYVLFFLTEIAPVDPEKKIFSADTALHIT